MIPMAMLALQSINTDIKEFKDAVRYYITFVMDVPGKKFKFGVWTIL